MEQFLTYFPSAFSWGNLAVLILGSAGGLFFGAMPGLSPTMAVALLVPFTFYLPADTSLILLGAVYTSAVAGGSISAILLSIPGAGGQVAGLMSYDQTKKFDKNPDRFGTGDPEGVCAAESANNATVAPAMIPLLTLSIPGSPTAAVLLGGLLIHGLFPGPDLFTEKADITYTFISGLLLAQFFMCFFGLLASRYSHLVANAPNYMMFAAVMILCVFGSYCVQNSYEDVILMFILGVLMFVLAKFGFPSAPIVLGIILGPIAEENFLRGKMIADTDVGVFSYFFTGGLNLALIALCLLSLIWGIYSEVKYMRNHSRKAAAAN